MMVNPYNQKASRVSLRPGDVQGYVFWSRNYQVFLTQSILETIENKTIPFICHMTITGYPRELDQATLSADKAIEQMNILSQRFSKKHLIWRYDPIVISEYTPVAWHLINFERLSARLRPFCDEVMVSFVHPYAKTQRNMAHQNVAWENPSLVEKQGLLMQLNDIAQSHGLKMSLCAQPELNPGGLVEAACIDSLRLSELAGRNIMVQNKPHRRDCGCVASKDIGDYDTCPHGCVYCYAVKNKNTAKSRFAAHDPEGAFLFSGRCVDGDDTAKGLLL